MSSQSDMSTSDNNLATIQADAVVLDKPSANSGLTPHRWKPGQSGNPSGRPKHDVGAEICRKIVENHRQTLEATILKQCKKDYKAVKFVFERAYGKLPQPLEHQGAGGGPIEVFFGVDMPQWLSPKPSEE